MKSPLEKYPTQSANRDTAFIPTKTRSSECSSYGPFYRDAIRLWRRKRTWNNAPCLSKLSHWWLVLKFFTEVFPFSDTSGLKEIFKTSFFFLYLDNFPVTKSKQKGLLSHLVKHRAGQFHFPDAEMPEFPALQKNCSSELDSVVSVLRRFVSHSCSSAKLWMNLKIHLKNPLWFLMLSQLHYSSFINIYHRPLQGIPPTHG